MFFIDKYSILAYDKLWVIQRPEITGHIHYTEFKSLPQIIGKRRSKQIDFTYLQTKKTSRNPSFTDGEKAYGS